MSRREKFVIIDGNALVHRAYHALPPLTTKEGKLVNAVYGFTSILLKVLKDLKPAYIGVAFDRAEPTFRHKEFPDYKAQRVKQPQEFYDQIPLTQEVLKAFQIPVLTKAGYEADDIIGFIAEKTRDLETIIVTGDLDTLQLVDDQTKVYTLKKGVNDIVIYGPEEVRERYGLEPDQMVDFKALRGDPSDNIPGVRGIGEKTAAELIKKFGSLKQLYQQLPSRKELKTAKLKKPLSQKIVQLLLDQKAEAELSRKLVTIITNIPLKFKKLDFQVKPLDYDQLFKLFQKLGFRTLLSRLPEVAKKHPGLGQGKLFQESGAGSRVSGRAREKRFNYQLINTEKDYQSFINQLSKQKIFALDTETTGLNALFASCVGLSFAWKPKEAYFVTGNLLRSLPPTELKKLAKILANPQIKKVGQNLKFDLEIIWGLGLDLQGIYFDTMIAAYLLTGGSRSVSLANLVFTELGHQMQPIEELIGPKGKKQLTMDQVPLDELYHYACEDADFTFRLYLKLKPQLEEKAILGLLEKIEMPLVRVLALMERNGVQINPQPLKRSSQKLHQQVKTLEEKIQKLAGIKFNVNSSVQLKEVLFKKLKISTEEIRRGKTGFSTAASELKKMIKAHPIISLVMQQRELAKLLSTYIDALPQLIQPETNRVHTSYNQTITSTGRLSSSDPNLQNIPIRTELGRQIRKAFIAQKGYRLMSIDYSQIELRVVASLANDPKMIGIFKGHGDIHQSTAAEIFELPLEQVTSDLRRKAKEVNFGIIYGMGAFGLAERTGISREEAGKFITTYFQKFKAVKVYLDQTVNLARKLGYVETLFGRRRYLPELNSGVMQIRNAAERMAVNMPIQGTAADLMKLAMIACQEFITSKYQDNEVKMILQVHDELVFEVKDNLAESVGRELQKRMEAVYKLKVPIKTDVKVGNNWEEMEPLK